MSVEHSVTVKGESWVCACGASGTERQSLQLHARVILGAHPRAFHSAALAAWRYRARAPLTRWVELERGGQR